MRQRLEFLDSLSTCWEDKVSPTPVCRSSGLQRTDCCVTSNGRQRRPRRHGTITQQESLANAKVSARQPWYVGRNSLNRPPVRIAQQYQRNLYIVEKYFQCATIPSLTMRVYLHSFSHCCLPNMSTSAKFRENLNLQQFKVIQGQCFWYQSKAHIRLPVSD